MKQQHCMHIYRYQCTAGHDVWLAHLNPLPHMPISGSSNSAANKDMMSKLLTNGNTIF